MAERLKISVQGIVQGVGFRPFVYALAKRFSLNGFVFNDSHGVIIEVEGKRESLKEFLVGLEKELPPLATIQHLKTEELAPVGYADFRIKPSEERKEKFTFISPDIATCVECREELFDSGDRRFNYPFINCTNCGPRFTIIQDVPYDREKTTMSEFPICPDCKKEYEDPANRRFHAQPNACHACGPGITLLTKGGKPLLQGIPSPYPLPQGERSKGSLKVGNPPSFGWRRGDFEIPYNKIIEESVKLLRKGAIIAVKGIGGYHLACDAGNPAAVSALRQRKYREDKPFALMVKDIGTVREFCEVNKEEEALLLSMRRPIVLLRKKAVKRIAGDVAPGNKFLGVMLPYTPLHHILLSASGLILVMTSGNMSDEPIAYDDKEALARLSSIADYFLSHNRKIHIRCDDSVSRVWRGKETVLRRARGYVPQPIKFTSNFPRHILACGAHLKNTFCLARENFAFLSHHIGDLENMETLKAFEEGIVHFENLFQINPEILAYDMHPEYLSTKYALDLKHHKGAKRIPVQHHHAHLASCMADNNLNKKVLGIIWDGLGYGTDGNLWGSEFLTGDFSGCERRAHFAYFPLPGGETAIRQPWRMGVSFLYGIYGDEIFNLPLEFLTKIKPEELEVVVKMLRNNFNSPLSCGAGRLFDGVSSIILSRERANYEGQAAVELEMAADETVEGSYGFDLSEEKSIIIIRPDRLIHGVVEDLEKKRAPGIISAKFHNTLAEIIADVSLRLKEETGVTDIVLSGGVFQNIRLLNLAGERLKRHGFNVYTHSRAPANDGGISLGQALIAGYKNGR